MQLCTAHRGQHLTLKDFYTLYKTPNKIENVSRKDNVIVFTSEKSIEKRIIANADYYHLMWKKDCKYQIKIEKLQFAPVLIDESHDIWGVNTIFFNNLVKWATDGASI